MLAPRAVWPVRARPIDNVEIRFVARRICRAASLKRVNRDARLTSLQSSLREVRIGSRHDSLLPTGTPDALPEAMLTVSKPILAVLLIASCASQPGGARARSPASTEQASTDAVRAMIAADYAGALAIAERGLLRNPQDPWLLYDRGAALAALGRFDEALETLLRAEGHFATLHDRSLPVYRRALILEARGRCAEASLELSNYALLVRDDAPELARESLTHVQYCFPPTAAQAAERGEEARLTLAAVDEHRQRSQAASTAAVKALIVGDYQRVLVEADAGLSDAPADAWLAYDRGIALVGLNRTDEAIAALRAAERLFPAEDSHDRSVAAYRRIVALEGAGRCTEVGQELAHYAALAGPEEAAHANAHVYFCRTASRKGPRPF
jgi:tetratricopeptide (TPR) repeat protein